MNAASSGWKRTPLQAAAVAVTETGFATAGFLVRKLDVDLAEAQRLLEQLEERRVVGPPQAGSRAVLVSDPFFLPAGLQGGAR